MRWTDCMARGHHAWTWADDTTDRQVCDDCGLPRGDEIEPQRPLLAIIIRVLRRRP